MGFAAQILASGYGIILVLVIVLVLEVLRPWGVSRTRKRARTSTIS